jgi:hypothetical protein
MREDPCNDGGVLDRGDQLHPASAARTAQGVEVEGPGASAPPTSSSGGFATPRPSLGPDAASLSVLAVIARLESKIWTVAAEFDRPPGFTPATAERRPPDSRRAAPAIRATRDG